MKWAVTIALLLFMAGIPPLVPEWTRNAVIVVVLLELISAAAIASFWAWRRLELVSRIATGLIATLCGYGVVDIVLWMRRSGETDDASSVLGLAIITLATGWFSVRGFSEQTRQQLAIGKYADDSLDAAAAAPGESIPDSRETHR